eukprot:CAMPEP_0178717172 /NCGR_PEP_ID=MMETSP0699-20121125/21751_1 /TAXON_ID=265572 /ORGANISM="Extubocellulus spinifer, Strain CCMP396" /LENGTH=508 /DNA_ID=CAMNT_0020366927 /DNA_START=139 /DNA_END=1667 /DNA_ORIENTATION=+
MKCSESPQWMALASAAASFRSDDKLNLRHLCSDSSRCAGLVATHASAAGGDDRMIMLDYSRQQVTGETMELLYDLADRVGFRDRRNEMRTGVKINSTEGRSVLHHALRMPRTYDYSKILSEVHAVRDAIDSFVGKVRSGEHGGATGKPLKSFLANVDPVDFKLCTSDLDPAETLIIIISKTFTTAETMLNARTARKWLLDGLADQGVTDEQDVIAKHVCAVSTAISKATDFGIDESNVFGFWNWVGGRFSVCSAVGLVPLSLQYSYDVMSSFLDGAHDIDEHFFDAPLRENIPVILGLLGIWNSTFMGYSTRALLPYSQALRRFPAHIQQVDMERVAIDGTTLPFPSGEINFGEPGTNGQHSFYQLMHQGELFTLAYGKTLQDLVAEGVGEALRPHKVFPGNRPSSSMLMTRLDAFAVGQLLAIYEHRTAVQGFIWGINSFDQWGVELGKVLAKQVRAQLNASRKSGASVQGFNSSTSEHLISSYVAFHYFRRFAQFSRVRYTADVQW